MDKNDRQNEAVKRLGSFWNEIRLCVPQPFLGLDFSRMEREKEKVCKVSPVACMAALSGSSAGDLYDGKGDHGCHGQKLHTNSY